MGPPRRRDIDTLLPSRPLYHGDAAARLSGRRRAPLRTAGRLQAAPAAARAETPPPFRRTFHQTHEATFHRPARAILEDETLARESEGDEGSAESERSQEEARKTPGHQHRLAALPRPPRASLAQRQPISLPLPRPASTLLVHHCAARRISPARFASCPCQPRPGARGQHFHCNASGTPHSHCSSVAARVREPPPA